MEDVQIILSALWVALMLTYLLGDVLRIFSGDFKAGEIGGKKLTQEMWLGMAVLMVIPIVMVFLSLVLKPKVNRWTNITLGVFYILSNSVSAFTDSWIYFIVFGVIEVALTALIVWYAWKWPKQES